jgi:hypothetical protein
MKFTLRTKLVAAACLAASILSLPSKAQSLSATNAASVSELRITLPVPSRSVEAPTGSQLEAQLRGLSLAAREDAIFTAVTSGNIPDFLRNMVVVSTSATISGTAYTLEYAVLPDYFAIGSDEDFFRIPMTPLLAQRICNALNCTLPTRRMVDQIWQAAPLKLNPQTIPPSDQMTTIPVMYTHHQMVQEQRNTHLGQHPAGTLVAGHKKDVILSNRIYTQSPPRRVVIYGWHYTSGTPIQPVYAGHGETYADYSHGIRTVLDTMRLNGQLISVRDLLKSPDLHVLLSDEGVIELPFYPLASTITVPNAWGVMRAGTTSLRLVLPEVAAVTAYRAHLSADGRTFDTPITLSPDNLVIDNLAPDQPVYIRLQAVSDHAGPYSEVLAGLPSGAPSGASTEVSSEEPSEILIVNGFDRAITGNTRDFVRHYVPEVRAQSRRFDTATNEAVAQGLVDLASYAAVIWILGAESTADETFSSGEQARVQAYLDAGGALFVSGSEIGWDLDSRGTASDRAFMHNYLKSAYVADAPGNQSNTWYRITGTAEGAFAGFPEFSFDNGTQGTYNVSWPDVLTGMNGGGIVLRYAGAATPNGAGVGFRGRFPGSSGAEGVVLVFGFPFETVYPAAVRTSLMEGILDYVLDPVSSSVDEPEVQMPLQLVLEQNYPNPFNGQTQFRYHLPEDSHVQLVIYATTGQRVTALEDTYRGAGTHEVRWNAGGLASGVYISALTAGGQTVHRTVLLLK